MEYTFKPSLNEQPITICLAEYNLTVKKGKQETVIPYAMVNDVVLNKSKKLFKTELHIDTQSKLTITNTYHASSKDVEDRSRAYSTFVRVLHFHLKDKSKARFAVLRIFGFSKEYSPTDIPLEFLP